MEHIPCGREPAVTIVVPLFNERPDVLTASLQSVSEQSFGDFECLIVDESTDPDSAAACQAFCQRDPRFLRVAPETRIGLAASLNLGVRLARAPLIARFDSDDLCVPGRLEAQVAFMAGHADVGVVGGAIEVMDDEGRLIGVRRYPELHRDIERQLQLTTPLAHPTVMMRRELFGRFGAYDPEFRNAEDLDLWLRFANHGVRFANLSAVLVRYRQQTTRRAPRHWHFNLRARLRNFRARLLLRRMVGIGVIAIWSSLPAGLQESIFKGLLLRKRSVTGS